MSNIYEGTQVEAILTNADAGVYTLIWKDDQKSFGGIVFDEDGCRFEPFGIDGELEINIDVMKEVVNLMIDIERG